MHWLQNGKVEGAVKRATPHADTVAAFFAGKGGMELRTVIKFAAALGLRLRIAFEPIEGVSEESGYKCDQ
ncbi:MAG TPA: hypothetical protein VIC84_02155 [Blastocatellia bacterium]